MEILTILCNVFFVLYTDYTGPKLGWSESGELLEAEIFSYDG